MYVSGSYISNDRRWPAELGLNIGSGPQNRIPGWVSVDIDQASKPDVTADVCALPFRDASFRLAYASHLLEHLDYRTQVPAALAELGRVLVPRGHLTVICPDIERAVLCGEPRQLLEAIVAWPDEWNHAKWPVKTPPRGHAWTATAAFVRAALVDAGFTIAVEWSGNLRALQDASYPVVDLGDWQCAFTALMR